MRSNGKLRSFRLSLAAMSVLAVSSVSAQIVQFNFTDTNNTAQIKASASANFFNPNSAGIEVATLGGLDKKIQLIVKNASNQTVFDKTSSFITIANKITAYNSTVFYGIKFAVPSLPEGSYKFTSKVLDSNNAVSSSNDYSVVIDKTAPTFGEYSWAMNYGRGLAPDSIPKFSTVEAKLIALSDVNDALSGMDKVTFETSWLDGVNQGKTYSSGAVSYDALTKIAQIGTGGMGTVTGAHFPSNVNNKMKMTFKMSDKAGNLATKDLVFYDNSKCSEAPVLVAIQDPTYTGKYLGVAAFQGFRAVPGAGPTPININPLKAVYRFKRSQSIWMSEGNIYGGYPIGTNSGLTYSDADYAYTIVTGTATDKGYFEYPTMGWTNDATWRCGPLSIANATFSPNAIPPKILSAKVYIEGVGWVPNSYNGLSPVAPFNTKITKAEFTAEARQYKQTASGFGSCEIPIGATSCTVDVNVAYKTTGQIGLSNPIASIKNTATGAVSVSTVLLYEYDAESPEFTALLSHDTNTKTVTFTATEYHSGSIWNRVKMKSGGLTVTNTQTGAETDIPANMVTTGNLSTFTASYSSLPEGSYSISAWAMDNYNNKVTKPLFNVEADGTPPQLSFSGLDNESVKKIGDLIISVTDNTDPSPAVVSAVLTGSQLTETITLGFNKQTNGKYRLESPRMFPSLDETQKYTLTVTAKDARNNTGSGSVSFLLKPENLVALGVIKGLGANQNLLDSANKPITYAKITTALTSQGEIAKGAQEAYFTLKANAPFAVMVAGVKVAPGETKMFQVVLDAQGKASLPIYPAVAGVKGTADFMIDIPQLLNN